MPRQAKPSMRRPRGRPYDVEMIRDFLDHLLWEVRIGHCEHTTPSQGVLNHELTEQLQKYQNKRQTVGLLMATRVPKHAVTPGGQDVQEMEEKGKQDALEKEQRAAHRRALAGFRERQLEHLEALRPLFDEALFCASNPRRFVVRDVPDVDADIQWLENDGRDDES